MAKRNNNDKGNGNVGSASTKLAALLQYDTETLRNVAGLSTQRRQGSRYETDSLAYTNKISNNTVTNDRLPEGYRTFGGILSVDMVQTINSYSTNYQYSPINIRCQQIYQQLKNYNRNTVGYSQSDIGKMIIHLDSMNLFIRQIRRALKAYVTWNNIDIHFAEAVVQSLGFSFTDIKTFYAEWVAFYNDTVIRSMSAVVVPANIKYIKHHDALVETIYSDDPLKFTEYYAVRFLSLYYLSNDGTLKLYSSNQSGWTLANCRTLWSLLINNYLDDVDFADIASDCLTVFGESLMTYDLFTEKEALTALYDEDFVNALKHGVAVGWDFVGRGTYSSDIREYNGKLVQGVIDSNGLPGRFGWNCGDYTSGGNPYDMIHNAAIESRDQLVSFPSDNPSPDDVLISTLFIPHTSVVTDAGNNQVAQMLVQHSGPEIIKYYQLHWISPITGMYGYSDKFTNGLMVASSNNEQTIQILNKLAEFHFGPTMWVTANYTDQAQSSVTAFARRIVDADHMIYIPIEQINAIHEYTLISLILEDQQPALKRS